jgi:hypothetical protein
MPVHTVTVSFDRVLILVARVTKKLALG